MPEAPCSESGADDARADRVEPRPVELRRLAVEAVDVADRHGEAVGAGLRHELGRLGRVGQRSGGDGPGDVLVAGDAAELRLDGATVPAARLDGARDERDVLLVRERGAVGQDGARARREGGRDQRRGRRSGRAGRRPPPAARPRGGHERGEQQVAARLGVASARRSGGSRPARAAAAARSTAAAVSRS